MREHQIFTVEDLHKYIKDKNSEYYSTRSEIVSMEKQIAALNDRIAMWEPYETNKPIRKKLREITPDKREKYKEDHRAELMLFESASNYFDELTASGEKINTKAWKKEREKLTDEKNHLYEDMKKMKEDIKTVENIRQTIDELAREYSTEQDHSRTTPENGILR